MVLQPAFFKLNVNCYGMGIFVIVTTLDDLKKQHCYKLFDVRVASMGRYPDPTICIQVNLSNW